MDIQEYFEDRISPYSKIFELYKYESYEITQDIIYDEITIPNPIEIFVTDFIFKKIRLSPSVQVLDIWFDEEAELEFNNHNNIREIIMINVNIQNKSLIDLLSNSIRFKYINCKLNGVELTKLLTEKYIKYFNTVVELNDLDSNIHRQITDKIINYETTVVKSKEFCRTIKEELVASVWHPDNVEKWLRNNIDLDLL